MLDEARGLLLLTKLTLTMNRTLVALCEQTKLVNFSHECGHTCPRTKNDTHNKHPCHDERVKRENRFPDGLFESLRYV